jgi:hypothetical protein
MDSGGRWGTIYKRQRVQASVCYGDKSHRTGILSVKITRGTVRIRMIYWIAPISLRRKVEPRERRVTTSFDRVKGFFRVAKWARGHGPGFGQSDVAVETKEITISYLGKSCR